MQKKWAFAEAIMSWQERDDKNTAESAIYARL